MRNIETNPESGISLVETLVAMGLLGIVSIGVTTLISSMGKSQKNLSQKLDEMTVVQEINSLLNDNTLCGPSFDGQLNGGPLQGGSLQLAYLNWGATGKRLVTRTAANTNTTAAQVVVTGLKVDVDNSSPINMRQTDPSNANAVIDVKKYPATLTVQVEKRQTGGEASYGGQAFVARSTRFSILRKSSDNSFIGCFSENSPARACEDEFGGTYDSSQFPHCALNRLGIGTRTPSPSNLKVLGPSAGSPTSSAYEDPTLAVEGNISSNGTVFFGNQKDTYIARHCAVSLAGGSSIDCNSTIGNNLDIVVAGPSLTSRVNAFRFDHYGVLNAGHGFAFNSAGYPPDDTWGSTIMASGYTGFSWKWNSAIPNDIGVFVNGQGRFRFNEKGIFHTTNGFSLLGGGASAGEVMAIAGQPSFTGFVRGWEPSLPEDIGVFLSGNGEFRFHKGGDFFTLNDVGAGHDVWASNQVRANSDERLKKDIVPLQGSLDKISQLNGVEFSWKNPKTSPHRQIGLIAQNVEKFFPQVVVAGQDGMKSLAYQNLIAPLIEAVKTLKTYFESLEARYLKDRDSQKTEMEALRREVAELREQVKALQNSKNK